MIYVYIPYLLLFIVSKCFEPIRSASVTRNIDKS